MESMALWNLLLSSATGLLVWMLKSSLDEQKRLSILLNRTREEMAKEYVTKAEVHSEFNRVIDRIEALDQKIDRLIQSELWDGVERRKVSR